MDKLTIDKIQKYWSGKRVPQQWYSNKTPLTLQWFNDISKKRYNIFYTYLKKFCEFKYHSKEKVLEIGCGIGTDSVEYAKHGAKVTAIDLGQDQVHLTKLNFELRNLKYDEISTGNVENLKFEDETFDLVYCFGVIHHTLDMQKAIDEIYRVLKKDGEAIIMIYARGWKHYLKRCLIHGIFKGKIFKYKFNWQKVYDEVSEVYGGSPMTKVLTKKQVIKLVKEFSIVSLSKDRLGEFFDYKPYNTIKFFNIISKIMYLFSLEKILGENWKIKLCKSKISKGKISDVVFRNY
jgi:ubiquinone/menaquinone biosynthesis C-methylase UbiE